MIDEYFWGKNVTEEEAVEEVERAIRKPTVEHCKDAIGKYTVIKFYTEYNKEED